MTNEDINDYLRLAIMEEVNKRLGKNFECVNDLIDYAKNLEKENEQLKLEKCELLGIIQKKDELINKLICCDNCKHFNKVRCCRNDDKCIWELAE